jgi:hypothetical protein
MVSNGSGNALDTCKAAVLIRDSFFAEKSVIGGASAMLP